MHSIRPVRSLVGFCVGALALCALTVGGATAGKDSERSGALTPAAEAAVRDLFPSATVVSVGREHENGVPFFEVALIEGGRTLEVEVAPDGAIGEIESEMALSDVSPDLLRAVAGHTRGALITKASRHEVRGVSRRGAVVALDTPRVFYELQYDDGGVLKQIAASADGQLIHEDDDDSSDSSSSDGSSDSDSVDDDDSDDSSDSDSSRRR